MTRVVAVFESPAAVERAAAAAARAGWRPVAVCSPAFDERILQLAGCTRSPVGLWSAVGGAAGTVFGLVLTVGTVRQWPGLIVSGKPLVALPPFLIIVFEMAILGAALAAVLTFWLASRRARRAAAGACAARTTDDRFTLLLESSSQPGTVDAALRSNGAIEWRIL